MGTEDKREVVIERDNQGNQGNTGNQGERGEKGDKGEIGEPGRSAGPMLWGIRRTLRRLLWATVLLYAIVAGVAVYAARTANSNHDALCALRTDLEKRVATSVQFLEENPDGAGGITPAVIKQGIKNQTDTIDILGSLNC